MLRKLYYLLALSRERHFGRAAQKCHISQPTLSNAIRQLEQDLGAPLVERGQRFVALTPEGERVLEFARRATADFEALTGAIDPRAGALTGRLRLAAIPTALPTVAPLVAAFARRHPNVRVILTSSSSQAIERDLDRFDLDAGVTYLDNEPLSGVAMQPLYSERYYLLTQRGPEWEGRTEATWTEAAALPLCLLTPDMQNRHIVDQAFRMAGKEVAPQVETNSIVNLFTMARQGPWSSIVPGPLLALLPPGEALIALPLVMPDLAYVVGIVYADRSPPAAVAKALAQVAAQEKLGEKIPALMREALARHGIGD
ncbi:LysR family transcriptional regulator [uncultured Rhodoblastus sp.]|uniref:LysR family transcriptional regulator n=1 Tax=uncultured Rhodoblastus sp. TaxID=543037 RepID=UPI0025CBD045|nr:LysR family transcriptional regulator [uncultured Rhodoblastus sp.]